MTHRMHESSDQTLLGIFAKYWQPGRVKTRLAAAIGEGAAAAIHRQCVCHLTDELGHLARHRILAYWPPESASKFREVIPPSWELIEQTAGDLGNRMSNFFATGFERGFGRIVLIGSDSPWIDAPIIERAFTALKRVPAVIGPSEDGGYYLIGLSQALPQLFSGVSWSSERVFEETRHRLNELALDYEALEAGNDIDTWDDLQKLLNRWRTDPRTSTVHQRLEAQLETHLRGRDREL